MLETLPDAVDSATVQEENVHRAYFLAEISFPKEQRQP